MPGFAQDSTAFFQALVDHGSEAELHMIPGRNHQMIIGDAARPGDPAREFILRFIAEHTTPPPRVASVLVNDGSAQRSMVTSLTVTFSTVMHFDPGAFELVRQGGGVIDLQVAATVVDGQTVASLTFVGADILGGSLADGHYTLRTHAGLIHDNLARPLAGGHVGLDDLASFVSTLGKGDGDPRFLWYFNGDLG
jgi:hypothetical protein